MKARINRILSMLLSAMIIITSALPYTAYAGETENDILYYGAEGNGIQSQSTTGGAITTTTPSAVTAVTVTPSDASVAKGGTLQFSAQVEGENGPGQEVTWSIEGETVTGTSINTEGLLTVAGEETAAILTVRATSAQDTDKYGEARVTVTGPEDEPVTFNDNNLRLAVNAALKKTSDHVITVGDMESLTELDASNWRIKDLTGLYTAVNLETLDLSGNPLDDANRNTWNFSEFAYEFAAFTKLKNLNLSNCRLGDIQTGSGSGTVPDSNTYLNYLIENLPSLETVDLSDNDLYGAYYFLKTVIYNNLKAIDFSGNRLTSVNGFDMRYFPSLEKLDISDNYIYWDELSGSWIENLINAGGIVEHAGQKNLAELYRLIVLKPGAGMSSYVSNSQAVAPDEDGVFACKAVVGDSVIFAAFSYADAFIKITVDGNEKFTATPIAQDSEISNQSNYYVLSGLEPGDHEVVLDTMHLNGDTKQYKMRITTAALPNEGENSAGIVDISLQYALCTKLGIDDPAGHVITREELAALTGSLSLSGISDLQGIEYLSGITSLTVSGDFTQVPALPAGLKKLDLNGKFGQLPELPTGLTSLTLSGNFADLPKLPEGLSTLSLTGEQYAVPADLPAGITNLTLKGSFSAAPILSNLVELKTLKVNAPNLSASVDVSKNTKITRYEMSAATDGSLSDLSGLAQLKNLKIYYARNSLQPKGLESCAKLQNIELSLLYPGTYSIPRIGDSVLDVIYSITSKSPEEFMTDVADSVVFDIGSTNGADNKWALSVGSNTLIKGASDTIEEISGQANFALDFEAPNLTRLSIGGEKKGRDVEGLNSALYKMPNLISLSISFSEMKEVPKGVESLVKLETLDFSSSQVQTIAADLSKCTSLKEIDGNYSALQVAPNAEELPASLEILNFYGTKIEYLPGSFAHMISLKELDIAQTPLLEFPEGVKYAFALEELNAHTGLYGYIPEDTFDKLVNLKYVYLGDWVPVVLENKERVPAPGTSAALAVEKLRKVAPEASISFSLPGDNPFFNTGTSNYSGLLEIKSDIGTIDGKPYETRSLALVVPVGTESIVLTPKAVLKDTAVTINGETAGSGQPIRVDGLHEGVNTVTIQSQNSFTNHLMRDTVTTYTLNVTVGEYASSLKEGNYYQTRLNMYKEGTTADSMSGKYIEPIAIVCLKDGRYEVRFTVTSSSSIPYVGYYYTGEEQPTEAEKLSSTSDDKTTYRVYTKTLEEPILLRLFPSPMGYYVKADMVIDNNGMIDITDTMPSVDKTELAAAISKAEDELKKSIYTDETYNALKAAYDAAVLVNTDVSATEEQVAAAITALTGAIAGLDTDQSKLADKGALAALLDEAKAIKQGNHSDTAWISLQSAIAAAQELYDKLEAAQEEADAAVKSLDAAIAQFNSDGSDHPLDPEPIEDGTYQVPLKIVQASNPDQLSMANDALDGPAKVTIEDGKSTVDITVKARIAGTIRGHLLKLWSYPGTELGDYENDIIPAEIIETYEDEGMDGSTGTFPRTFRIERPATEEESFYIRVSVDAMAGFDQDAKLVLDYANAVKEGEEPGDEPNPDKEPVKTVEAAGGEASLGSGVASGLGDNDNIGIRFRDELNSDTLGLNVPASVIKKLFEGKDDWELKVVKSETASEDVDAVKDILPRRGEIAGTVDISSQMVKSGENSVDVTQLSDKIKVTVTLTQEQISQLEGKAELKLYWYDETNNKLVDMNAVFDLAAGTVYFYTDHFSTYVIAGITAQSGGSGGTGGGSSAAEKYTIRASSGEGGTITPEGYVKVTAGADRKFTVKANEGYEIKDVLVNGESVGAVEEYTFEDVSEDGSIEAQFQSTGEVPVLPVFDDMAGHWAEKYIQIAVGKGLFSGTGENEFSPDIPVTRGMFVTVLGRLHGIDAGQYVENKFTDVDAGIYYAPYIAWASENSIVSGTGDGRFSPEAQITREEAAVIIDRYAKYAGLSVEAEQEQASAEGFADADSISSWSKDSVERMKNAGILSGKTGNLFDPKGTATRAEAATIFVKLKGWDK